MSKRVTKEWVEERLNKFAFDLDKEISEAFSRQNDRISKLEGDANQPLVIKIAGDAVCKACGVNFDELDTSKCSYRNTPLTDAERARLKIAIEKYGCEFKPPKQYLVSMDGEVSIGFGNEHRINIWDKDKCPKWACYKGFGRKNADGLLKSYSELGEYPNIPGLQPGMLCLMEEVGGAIKHYKLLSILECNLDIDVDWRKCVGTEYQGNAECFVGNYEGVHGWWCPYLPDTDVQIDCDFNERKPKCKCHKQAANPKFIKANILKAYGAKEWLLVWFDSFAGEIGCSYPMLIRGLAGTEDLTWGQKDDAICLALDNLWDYK